MIVLRVSKMLLVVRSSARSERRCRLHVIAGSRSSLRNGECACRRRRQVPRELPEDALPHLLQSVVEGRKNNSGMLPGRAQRAVVGLEPLLEELLGVVAVDAEGLSQLQNV